MEFGVLGPLEIRDDDGRQLPLTHGRERALLALLLLHANEVVSLDRIVDDLWGERAPATADKIVRNQISHLRRLVDGSLVTAGRGYRLEVPPGAVDVDRFDSLVARGRRELEAGRPSAAAELLAQALSLWRGPPLEEFAYERFAVGEIARLEELRVTAIEDRIDAELALGLHVEVLPDLEPLVQRYPLRERLRRQLMLALYRSGRQAEALEQYRDARAALVDELGLEPTDELRDLERSILAHDPKLAPPARRVTTESRKGATARRSSRDLLDPRILVLAGLVLLVAAAAAAAVRILGGASGPSPPAAGNAVAVVDPTNGRIVGRVGVGTLPVAVAVGARYVWVANAGDGTLSKIDPRTRTVVDTIGLGVPASDVAVGEGSVWVVSGSEGTLVQIDPRTGVILHRRNLGGSNTIAPNGAYTVAVGAGAVWVGSASWRVLRIDPATAEVSGTIAVGSLPATLDAAGGEVWVALIDGRTVRIDGLAMRKTGTFSGAFFPLSLAVGERTAWVGDEAGDVWRVDRATMRGTVVAHVPTRPTGIAVSGADVWVASSRTNALTRLAEGSRKPQATVALGGSPLDVAAGARALWVTLGRRSP